MILVSFIVPVYNQEAFVRKCLESITNQGIDSDSYEIIIVNDCSTDTSLSICKKFADEKENINILIIDKQQNEGIEKARHSGYLVAKGRYIAHVDSDDFLEPNIYGRMLEKAEEYDADYVECNSYRYIGNKFFHRRFTREQKVWGLITQPDLFEKYYISFFGINILNVNVWGKLYRKSTLDEAKLQPSGYKMGEDLIYNLKIFPFLKKIYIMNDIGYNYRWGGMTSGFNPSLYSDLRRMYVFKIEQAMEHNYQRAILPCNIELKNILRSEISQRISYKIETSEQTIKFIEQELETPIWLKIIDSIKSSQYSQNDIWPEIISHDAAGVYDFCNNIVKQNRLKSRLKHFAGIVINKILC